MMAWLLPSELSAQQTTLDLEYRFNPVYSRGFRQPLYAGDRAGFFAMQRTRLILNYENQDSLLARLVVQDRRAWGEVNERQDVAELAIFRAWVEKKLGEKFAIKLGRQGLVYDDQHLLGLLNWGGTLAHDLVLGKYERKDFKAHLGLAFNANRINELKRELYERDFYKNMQFLWLHKDWAKLKSSLILINRGLDKPDTTLSYTQTFGTNTSFQINNKLALKGIYYHQLGRDITDRKVNAHFWSAQLLYDLSNNVKVTAGIETTSGTDGNLISIPGETNQSFDILYGLLHGHYGYIDYFYLLIDPVFGLHDYYVKAEVKASNKLQIRNHVHLFYSNADAYRPDDLLFTNTLDPYLGLENDLLLTYSWSKTFKASVGHSIMFGTSSLDAMFGGTPSRENQYFYMVITAAPRLLHKTD